MVRILFLLPRIRKMLMHQLHFFGRYAYVEEEQRECKKILTVDKHILVNIAPRSKQVTIKL